MYLYPDLPELDYDPVLDYHKEVGSSKEVEESATVRPPTINQGPVIESTIGEGEAIEVIVSLWYWWKEVAFISIVTALMMNYFITRPELGVNARRIRRWIEHMLGRPVSLAANTRICVFCNLN